MVSVRATSAPCFNSPMNFHISLAMQKTRSVLAVLTSLLILCSVALGQNPFEEGNRRVKTTLIQDRVNFQPWIHDNDHSGLIGVKFEIEPGWHLYWANSGESGQPTSVSWTLPEGWKAGDLNWPIPVKFIERGNIITYGYKDSVLLFSPVFNPPVEQANGSTIEIRASVSWLVCKEICVPGQRELTAKIDYSAEAALTPSASSG